MLASAASLAPVAAVADTTTYQFAGTYFVDGGAQAYTGSFVVADPVRTSVRPAMAPDVSLPAYGDIWAGTSHFYTGGQSLEITFASGTRISASSLDIVVNNTTFQGDGSPYPMGLSAQLYAPAIGLTGPTTPVCDTDDQSCGEDDDPLYEDATQAAIMRTTGVYFAFWGGALAGEPGMPNLAQIGQGGLGIYSHNLLAQPTTTLTTLSQFDATVTTSPVPEPASALLLGAGAALLLRIGRQGARR